MICVHKQCLLFGRIVREGRESRISSSRSDKHPLCVPPPEDELQKTEGNSICGSSGLSEGTGGGERREERWMWHRGGREGRCSWCCIECAPTSL